MTKTKANGRFLVACGRFLLALYFLVPGVLKFVAFEMHVAMMTGHHVPYASLLLPIAATAQIAGGVLLLTRNRVRLASLGFVLYILLINMLMHDFWNYSGTIAQHELQNFIKNLGILAGLLILAGISPNRKLALKDLLTPDAIT